MKKIKLKESQFNRLIEINTTLGSDNPSTVQEYPSSTVSATANIIDTDGNYTYGKPKTMDKVQRDLSSQSFMDGRRKW